MNSFRASILDFPPTSARSVPEIPLAIQANSNLPHAVLSTPSNVLSDQSPAGLHIALPSHHQGRPPKSRSVGGLGFSNGERAWPARRASDFAKSYHTPTCHGLLILRPTYPYWSSSTPTVGSRFPKSHRRA